MQVARELGSTSAQLRLFLRDLSAFAGGKGFTALIFAFFGALVEGVGLVLFIPFISVITDSSNNGGWTQDAVTWIFAWFSAENRLAKLSLLVALFAALMILRSIVIVVRDVTIAQLEIGFIQHIRSRIAHHLGHARWDTLSGLRYSRIVHLMSADLQRFDHATNLVLHDATTVIVLASQIALAFIIAPLLAALALCVILVGAAALLPMIRQARRLGTSVSDAYLSLLDSTSQFLGALKLAISQNLQDNFNREFDETLSTLKAQQISYVRQQTIATLGLTTLSGIIGAAFIVVGVAVFDISASVLITLLVILVRMSGPALALQLDLQQIVYTLPAYQKIRELENEIVLGNMAPDISADAIMDLPIGSIIFSGVSYYHRIATGNTGAIGGVRDLNLIIEPGSIVGITGPSGAGKTTFADLLVGLYSPQYGEISIGSIPLRGLSVISWRNSVSYVAQEPFLFHDTIRRNLLWANTQADETELWDVLRAAGAEELVRNAKRGLDTVIGERGSLLSGGERQRLCLARAMLRRPRLLVLDEATSAIDIEGERTLLDRLMSVTPRPTIVMIAHRRETLHSCKRVLCFEAGKIVSDASLLEPISKLPAAVDPL